MKRVETFGSEAAEKDKSQASQLDHTVKRARSYSKHFKKGLVICDKHRERANQIAEMTVIGDVEGKDVILVDDLVDTAGTLCKAAGILIEKGAKSVRALCAHPILSGKAYENIANSKLDELIVSDTIPLKQKSPKIKVLSSNCSLFNSQQLLQLTVQP